MAKELLTTDKRRQRGQGLVEFAFSSVFLILVLVGITEIGRMFIYYVALRDAAEEGALYGSVEPDDLDNIFARVRDSSCCPLDLSDTQSVFVAVKYSGQICSGNEIAVTVSAFFPIGVPFLGAILGSQRILLSTTSRNMILRPPC